MTLRLAKQSGDLGTFTVYTYAQAVYLLPYAVLAVPGRDERLPGARRAQRRGRGRHRHAGAHPAGGARADRAVGRGAHRRGAGRRRLLLAARRPPRRRRHEHAPPWPRCPATLTAYAPGLVGFGLTALLTRALYVRGRPTDAGLAAALGLEPRRPAAARRARRAGRARRSPCAGWASASTHRHDGVGRRARAARAPHLGPRGHPGRRPHHRGARRRRRPRRRGRATSSPTAAPSTACPRRSLVGAGGRRWSPSWWGWSRCRSATAR